MKICVNYDCYNDVTGYVSGRVRVKHDRGAHGASTGHTGHAAGNTGHAICRHHQGKHAARI